MAKAKFVVQVSENRPVLHFQVGLKGEYRKVDLPKPKKYNLKGLKATTSLAGSSTVYHLIPLTAFTKKGAFKTKHGFSIGGAVEAAVKQYQKHGA